MDSVPASCGFLDEGPLLSVGSLDEGPLTSCGLFYEATGHTVIFRR